MCTAYVAIDVQNLESSAEDAKIAIPLNFVLDRIRQDSKLTVLRAYADWNDPSIVARQADYMKNGFELHQLVSNSRGKNTADMMLALDAVESSFTAGSPDHYVIVSGDGDFVPLAIKLRKFGKRVTGIGFRACTSAIFSAVVDEFIYLDDFMPHNNPQQVPAPVVTTDETGEVGIKLPGDSLPLVFDTDRDAAMSYRKILEKIKRVKVPCYDDRRQLMQRMYEMFEETPGFISVGAIQNELNDFNNTRTMGLYPNIIYQLIHTMGIARVFDTEREFRSFDENLCLKPCVTLDEAEELVHKTYLQGLRLAVSEVPMIPEGLALFLFDEISDKGVKTIRRLLGDDTPINSMAAAFQQALSKG